MTEWNYSIIIQEYFPRKKKKRANKPWRKSNILNIFFQDLLEFRDSGLRVCSLIRKKPHSIFLKITCFTRKPILHLYFRKKNGVKWTSAHFLLILLKHYTVSLSACFPYCMFSHKSNKKYLYIVELYLQSKGWGFKENVWIWKCVFTHIVFQIFSFTISKQRMFNWTLSPSGQGLLIFIF